MRTMEGDVMGFLTESYRTGIAHDFLPLSLGSHVVTRDFSREQFPVPGQQCQFVDMFDTYSFGISVLIDTGIRVFITIIMRKFALYDFLITSNRSNRLN